MKLTIFFPKNLSQLSCFNSFFSSHYSRTSQIRLLGMTDLENCHFFLLKSFPSLVFTLQIVHTQRNSVRLIPGPADDLTKFDVICFLLISWLIVCNSATPRPASFVCDRRRQHDDAMHDLYLRLSRILFCHSATRLA